MRRFDNDLVWALFFIVIVLLVGGYYETLNVRDSANHHACETVNDGRQNLDRRSNALSHYIDTVLRLDAAAEKIRPTPPPLLKLHDEEVRALRRLQEAQKPLPLIACP